MFDAIMTGIVIVYIISALFALFFTVALFYAEAKKMLTILLILSLLVIVCSFWTGMNLPYISLKTKGEIYIYPGDRKKVSEAKAIEEVFSRYGITDIWGEM
jgi:lysylphosphatidylglycerol synthetase-like protein (DUF2156 family)